MVEYLHGKMQLKTGLIQSQVKGGFNPLDDILFKIPGLVHICTLAKYSLVRVKPSEGCTQLLTSTLAQKDSGRG